MKLRRRRRVKAFPQKRSQLCVGVGFCPQLGGVGPYPAQCIWQGSGFAADQTNAMLATSDGGDKSSRKRKSLRLLGTAGFVEGFAI